MKMDDFGEAADRAWAFSGSLISGVNLSATLMTLLVAKGILTKADALWAIDEAAESSAKMDLPDVYARGIVDTFARVREAFDSAF
ncbi:hypothetical protein [Sphingomonas kyeonggiensis]|uniref:Uncharacterized protein n=1 Tax=Sphingomonas kyeonggiensis TaxID=1268553 RepID=A0A7W6JXP5_9SPHN|nr:hypothetical protein [Sphingomonas kyeonggiensis]MBB4100471.1 hypothetical protein [Sphingomonas kyeonggiensis]